VQNQTTPSPALATLLEDRGRLRAALPATPRAGLTELDSTRLAVVYKRQSSYEQTKNNVWSREMQDRLVDQARADGFRDDQIVIEERDLGISGTLSASERPGLAHVVELVESGQVGTLYTVAISRLTRDQTLIDGMQLGVLFKRHNVVLCLPTARLNLRDRMHERLYRMECQQSADEIDLMKSRLGVPKRYKALSGRWDGRSVPLGYVLDTDKHSETFERFLVYEPHAEIVRAIYAAVIETGTPTRAARLLRTRGVIVPDFPPDLAEARRRSGLARRPSPNAVAGGFTITGSLIRSIAGNPAYVGWWLVDGQVARTDNHPALIDEATFLAAQAALAAYGRRDGRQPGRGSTAPQLLSGLVTCVRHPVPAPMLAAQSRHGRYECSAEYRRGAAEHTCTLLDARTLDEPVADIVLNRCSFGAYADEVLTQLEAEHDAARETARQRRRELARLEGEVATLKQNLAVTKTPAQAATIFELIDQRTAQLTALADEAATPTARILSAAQVASVRAFLADLRSGWAEQPRDLRNELLRLLLAGVDVDAGRDAIAVTVRWQSGATQTLHIERPPTRRIGKQRWTADEDAWLRAHYAAASVATIRARFPDRTASAVQQRANTMGLIRGVSHGGSAVAWTADEDTAIRHHAEGRISAAELAERLPERSAWAILARRRVLGVTPPRPGTVTWRVVGEAGAAGEPLTLTPRSRSTRRA
jgi:DNA invertase Pin-like site-specific DNA recombinase